MQQPQRAAKAPKPLIRSVTRLKRIPANRGSQSRPFVFIVMNIGHHISCDSVKMMSHNYLNLCLPSRVWKIYKEEIAALRIIKIVTGNNCHGWYPKAPCSCFRGVNHNVWFIVFFSMQYKFKELSRTSLMTKIYNIVSTTHGTACWAAANLSALQIEKQMEYLNIFWFSFLNNLMIMLWMGISITNIEEDQIVCCVSAVMAKFHLPCTPGGIFASLFGIKDK